MTDKTEDIEIRLLLEALFQKHHYDFRGYALASMKRRLRQAREKMGFVNFSLMQSALIHDATTLPKLLDYLTVQVSEMYRDPSYFCALRERVVPHLRTYPSLKVWIAGCSGGEELYSMVILFREEGLESRTIFYATDVSHEALGRAERGIYDLDRIRLFTENHRRSGGKTSLSDFYTAGYGGATFERNLRDRVVLADHSLATDSVFGEMHLISCRNVLIYFDRALQNRAVGLFKDSLTRKGFLGLGAKENLRFTEHGPDFSDFEKEERIYQKRSAA
jgi:chemotaxis protein methyltransferase CheR